MNTSTFGRTNEKYSGRLVALTGSGNPLAEYQAIAGRTLSSGDSTRFNVVEFPAMPDELSLDRRTVYVAEPNMVLPDGVHVYKYTTPLEIPFRFKLFGSDREYCGQDGPAALLAIAARLHAFVLPLNPKPEKINFAATINYDNNQQEQAQKEKAEEGSNSSPRGRPSAALVLGGQEYIRPPVVCFLELLRISDQTDQMGIFCRGYVKDVSVKFFGPWLRGTGRQFNVPTSAEYGFTFVHVPSHQNDVVGALVSQLSLPQTQAYAGDVLDKFYNTAALNTVFSVQGLGLANPSVNQPTASRVSSSAPATPAEEEEGTLMRLFRQEVLNIWYPGE